MQSDGPAGTCSQAQRSGRPPMPHRRARSRSADPAITRAGTSADGEQGEGNGDRPVISADGGRLFVRCFDAAMNVREDVAGDVLASLTTMQWNSPSKAWTGGATVADSLLSTAGLAGRARARPRGRRRVLPAHRLRHRGS